MPLQLDSLQSANVLKSHYRQNSTMPIIFLSFLALINSASYAPTWLASNYIRSANQDLFNTLTGSGVVNTYSFTFSSPLSGVPHLGYGIKSYQGNDYFGQERFQIRRVNLTNDAFTVAVELIGATNLYILNVPYIAIDPLFPHHLNSFDNVPVNYSAGPLLNVSVRNSVSTTYYFNVINYTDQAMPSSHNRFSSPLSSNKILLFLTCMYITGNNEPFSAPSSDYNPLDLHVYTEILSNQTYLINVTLRIKINLERLQYSMIFFNQDEVQASLQYFLEYQKIDFLTSVGGFLPVPPQFVDNFIMGFTEFSSYRTLAAIHFQWSFTIQNGVHGVYMPPSIGRSPYKTVITRVQFTVFYMKTWICPNNTFMDIPTNLCKDCPFQGCILCLSYKKCSVCDASNQYKLQGSGCIRCDVDNNFYLNLDTLQSQQCPQHQCRKSRVQKGQCNTLIITISSSVKLPIVYNQSFVAIENSGIHLSHSSYRQQTKQVKIYADYDRDIASNQNIVVYVGKNNRRAVQVDSCVALMVYTPLQCQYEDGFLKLMQAICITSFLILFFSLFTAKIVGLQLFGVLQLAYFALGSYQYLNIYNAPFQMLKSANGYNLQHLLPTTSPTKILHYLNISNTFLNNINIMLLLPVLLMILSFVIYVLSKLALNKIMEQKITFFFKQGFITLILFNAFNFCYSAGLHFRYGYLSITLEWAIGSWVVIGLGVLIFGVLVGIMQIGDSQHFGQFKNKFKQAWVCRFYIPLSVIYRAAIAFYLSSNIDYQDSTLLVLAASISFLLYFIVNLPFINYYQNYRAGICHLTQLITLLATNYYRSMKSNTPIGIKSRLYAFTILLIVMICICVLISIVVLAVEIVEWVRNICKMRARRVHDQNRRQTEASMVEIQASVNYYSQKF